jgi:hypothetical protein
VTEPGDVEVERSAPRAADLPALFFQPSEFFRRVDLDHRWWFLSALLIAGISSASGRVDQNLIREELGQARPGWDQLAPYLVDSWLTFWVFILVTATMYAAFYWYVGGWWYKVRLKWSGASDPDARTARLVMVTAAVVLGLPTVLLLVAQTVVFPSYRVAWESDEFLSAALLIFPFWSVYTSYRGVRTRFDVAKWKSRVWFLILPSLVFVFAFGVIVVLYALLVPLVQGGPGTFAAAEVAERAISA